MLSGRVTRRREALYVAVPALVYLVFAMAGGMNIDVRHARQRTRPIVRVRGRASAPRSLVERG